MCVCVCCVRVRVFDGNMFLQAVESLLRERTTGAYGFVCVCDVMVVYMM
jgi:hypothetical protein